MKILYETDRLFARLLSINDKDAYYIMKSDPRVTSNYGMEPYSRQGSDRKLQSMIDIEGKEAYSVAVCLKETDELIGSICLWNLEEKIHKGELGYEFAYDYCYQGYGPESVEGFIHYMKDTYGYTIFTGCPSEKNKASNRLLQKLGFTFMYKFEERDMFLNQYEKTV